MQLYWVEDKLEELRQVTAERDTLRRQGRATEVSAPGVYEMTLLPDQHVDDRLNRAYERIVRLEATLERIRGAIEADPQVILPGDYSRTSEYFAWHDGVDACHAWARRVVAEAMEAL